MVSERKKRTAIFIISAFFVPWLIAGSVLALTQTRPPVIDLPFLRSVFGLTPTWHNLQTAFRNQHRLFLGGIIMSLPFAGLVMISVADHKSLIRTFAFIGIFMVALAANGLDCLWLFRPGHDLIIVMAIRRALPWAGIGAVAYTGLNNLLHIEASWISS